MKMVAKNQKVFFTSSFPMIPSKKLVQTLHQPFQEVLRPRGHQLHLAGGELGENNQRHRHDPRHQHRIGDRKTSNLPQVHRVRSQCVLPAPGVGNDAGDRNLRAVSSRWRGTQCQ